MSMSNPYLTIPWIPDEDSPRWPGAGGESPTAPTVWELCQKISNDMEDFNFDLFFRKFGLDSPICRALEKFSVEGFRALVEAAFTPVEKDMASCNVKFVAVHRACVSLGKDLERLNRIFSTIAQAELQVSSILRNVQWMQQVNQCKIDDMKRYAVNKIEKNDELESPLSSPANHPSTSFLAGLFHWSHHRAVYRSSVRTANNAGRSSLPPPTASQPTAPPAIPRFLLPFRRPHHGAPVPNSGQYDAGSHPRRLRSRHSITYLPDREPVHRLPHPPHPPHPPFSDNFRHLNAPRRGHEQVPPPPYRPTVVLWSG